MTAQQTESFRSLFLGTLRGRAISALVIVALLLGIVAEGISIVQVPAKASTNQGLRPSSA